MALSEAEKAELAALKAEAQGLSESEKKELAALRLEASAPPQSEGGFLEGAGKVLDFAGGATRAGAAGLAGLATGKELTSMKEFLEAVTGKRAFPSTRDYLERGGVGELGRVSDLPVVGQYVTPGSALDVTGRGAIGFAGDLALDPANLLSLGAAGAARAGARGASAAASLSKAASVVGDIANPLAPLARFGGRAIYRSGLKELDEAASKAGKGANAVSDLLWQNRIAGTNRQIANQSVDAMGALKNRVKELEQLAGERGARIDPTEIFGGAMDKTAAYGKRPIYKAQATKYDDLIQDYMAEAHATPAEISQWKTDFYNEAGPGAYQTGVRPHPVDQEILKEMGRDSRKAIEAAVDQYVPESTGVLASKNRDLGVLLSTANKMGTEAMKGERKNLLTSVDAMLLGQGVLLGASNPATSTAFGLKKAADALKTTAVRTRGGLLLDDAARSTLLAPAVKRAYIDSMLADDRARSTWEAIMEAQGNK